MVNVKVTFSALITRIINTICMFEWTYGSPSCSHLLATKHFAIMRSNEWVRTVREMVATRRQWIANNNTACTVCVTRQPQQTAEPSYSNDQIDINPMVSSHLNPNSITLRIFSPLIHYCHSISYHNTVHYRILYYNTLLSLPIQPFTGHCRLLTSPV